MTRRSRDGFLSGLDTLTLAARTFLSLPCVNFFTIPSFQNSLEVESLFTITTSPTDMDGPFWFFALHACCSRRPVKFSFLYWLVNICKMFFWYRALFVKVLDVLTTSKCSLFGVVVIRRPFIKCEGLSRYETDSLSSYR